jgi:hypothetical protein
MPKRKTRLEYLRGENSNEKERVVRRGMVRKRYY